MTIEVTPWGLHWEVLTTEGNTYYHAIFIGTNAKELAGEYAEFRRVKSGHTFRAISETAYKALLRKTCPRSS